MTDHATSVRLFVSTLRGRVDWFRCFDCRGHNDSYQVQQAVWGTAVPNESEIKKQLFNEASAEQKPPTKSGRAPLYLCLVCLQRRLDRDLKLGDFTAAPINNAIRFAYDMGCAEVNSYL